MEINELIIRVPGMNAREARSLANQVAEKLSESMGTEKRLRQIDQVDISLQREAGTGPVRLADRIAQEIRQQINEK